jgi:hypothetical protein
MAWSLSPDSDDANLEIVSKYLDAKRAQAETMRGLQMEVKIDARLPGLQKRGTMFVLRSISRLGQITFKSLGFQGDDTVKKEVIARYLQLDSEAKETGEVAITPVNYKFKHKGSIERDGQRAEIFQLTPKRKGAGLFKGELWLDATTGMPVRESGQLVKTPSVFLKKVQFVREYEIRDGVALPKHIESKVDVRIVGRAELDVDFSNFTKRDVEDASAALIVP